MGGIGIVNNPRSRRNRRRPGTARRLRELLGADGELLDASTPDELDRALERFRASRIDVLGVNGGDGTIHVVMTALARTRGAEPLPRLLLLRGGSMNTVARANGIRGNPERILWDVVTRRRAGLPLRIVERDLLRIEVDGRPPIFGFLFGTGAMVAFLEAYYAGGRAAPAAAASLVLRGMASSLVNGRLARELSRHDRLRVASDGEEWPEQSYLALLAGSVPQIGFGFRALARCAEQPGFFHAVGVTGSLLQVALAAPRIAAGRPWRRRLALDEVARELLVDAEGLRFTVDGDLYASPGEVRVTTGPPVEVIVPGRAVPGQV
ncbi:MAG TPA: diacylglycerol kinase family protein [Anaeromyxobacteraceae bacterium]|nr:diacylglycerol kinase family protein [Anaeromyxobacteraceae bacterium]